MAWREESTPWGVILWFDYGTGPTRNSHDLEIGSYENLDPSLIPPIQHPTTVAGHTASVQRVEPENATAVQVYGVQGQNPGFLIGKLAQDRVTLDEVGRILAGMNFIGHPEVVTTWLPPPTPLTCPRRPRGPAGPPY